MTYKEQMALAVKVNGKIMREEKETVFLPFDTEYSILLRNLNSVRAVAKISIDGKDISSSNIVVPANSSVEVERFIENMDSGYRFKFIEKTKEISEYRGDRIEDGIIRVEFWYEVPSNINILDIINSSKKYVYDFDPDVYRRHTGTRPYDEPYTISWDSNSSYSSVVDPTMTPVSSSVNTRGIVPPGKIRKSDNGITVRGADSNQKFTEIGHIPLESTSHVICLNLKGMIEETTPVVNIVSTRDKLVCENCGKKHSSNTSYCSRCGTRLIRFA